MIKEQHPWIDRLTIEYEYSDKAFKKLKQTKHVYIASDGGLEYEDLTFGRVIATETDILWYGNGHVPPSCSSSTLRSETYGGLVAHIILTSINKFHELCTAEKVYTFVTDSANLLTRLHSL